MTPLELEALAAKYREMIALRRDTGSKDGARLKALAARFPGVLRELDTRTMASLEERLAEMEAALAGSSVPAWASTQLAFHAWVRLALWMRADGVTGNAQAWAEAYVPRDVGDPPREALSAARLAELVSPPAGRVSLAARNAVAIEGVDLDVLLFGVRGQ